MLVFSKDGVHVMVPIDITKCNNPSCPMRTSTRTPYATRRAMHPPPPAPHRSLFLSICFPPVPSSPTYKISLSSDTQAASRLSSALVTPNPPLKSSRVAIFLRPTYKPTRCGAPCMCKINIMLCRKSKALSTRLANNSHKKKLD